jgi:predicted glycoside hydrolase/deacetylase ChbG (UPF0249 family)
VIGTGVRLWINADDFGLTPGVSEGICDSVLGGVVGTTSAMLCAEDADATIARYAPRIPGRIGVHLQLTSGRPRSAPADVPSLVGPDGRFPAKRGELRKPDPAEVEREWEAQIAALGALGISPTHLDTHHHVHWLPRVFEVYAELARRHGLPARGGSRLHVQNLRRRGVPCADHFTGGFYDGALDADHLVAVATAGAAAVTVGGSVELMCHPARVDEPLRARSDYVEPRECELAALCTPGLAGRLAEHGLVLVGPAELASRPPGETACPS